MWTKCHLQNNNNEDDDDDDDDDNNNNNNNNNNLFVTESNKRLATRNWIRSYDYLCTSAARCPMS
jgi:hypothetical protein